MDNENSNKEKELEVIIGDSSELVISEVKDYMTDLKPKGKEKKHVVIPSAKNNKKPDQS